MLRKTFLAGAAALALGTTAFAPTNASAGWAGHAGWQGWHQGWHDGWHHGGFYRPAVRVYAGPVYGGACLARRVVYTPYGPALRWVNICY